MSSCKSLLFLALFAMAISTVVLAQQAKHNEKCANDLICEQMKGYVCTENKCQCEAGFFADQEKGCLARLGDKCSLAKGPTSQLRCQDPNAFCDSRTEKCVCSEGKTCSNAITFGPTIFTTILTTITAVIAYMKM